MTTPEAIATRVRELHLGPNPTFVSLQDAVRDVTWRQARERVGPLHTIAELVYHIHFFVRVGLKILDNEPLDGGDSDRHSFDAPEIASQEQWEELLEGVWSDAERFARAVEALPESTLWDTVLEPKYGSYYRNLHGTIEHSYYHLGQITLIRKLLTEEPLGRHPPPRGPRGR